MKNPFKYRYSCEIPGNICLENLLREFPIITLKHKDNPSKILDRVAFVLDTLVKRSRARFGLEGKVGTHPISLCSKLMQLYVRDYYFYLNYLVERNVIYITKVHSEGNCTQYAFHEKHTCQETKKWIVFDKAFLKSIYKFNMNEAKGKYPSLCEAFDRMAVDWDKVFEVKDALTLSGKQIDWSRQEDILWELDDHRMLRFTVGKTNRLYSSFSFLQSEFRGCLLVDGKKLVGLDLKNSIPFLSIGLFNLNLLQDYGLLEDILAYNPGLKTLVQNEEPKINQDPRYLETGADSFINSPIIVVEIANSLENYPDVLNYIKEVTQGTLYEFLQEDYEFWLNKKYDRKVAKQKLLITHNAQEFEDSPESKVFELSFPSVFKAFRQLQKGFRKRRHGHGLGKWKKGDQVSTYAYVTQRFEAKIILDIVCHAIHDKDPKTPLFTIHDCIYTTEEYSNLVQNVLESTIQSIIGHKPHIEKTIY